MGPRPKYLYVPTIFTSKGKRMYNIKKKIRANKNILSYLMQSIQIILNVFFSFKLLFYL